MLPVGMDYTVVLPSYTVGPRAYEKFGTIASKAGKRMILISGVNSWNAVQEIFIKLISDAGLEIVRHEFYGINCTYERMHELSRLIKESKADFVVGIGGGKALDTAKGAAYEAGVPVYTLPTIASTCAAASTLSVVYKSNGEFDSFYFFDKPADHVFINTQVIADAPTQYFIAGIGDTLSKYFETHLATRGDELDHNSELGVTISNMCYFPFLKFAKIGIEDCKKNIASFELAQVTLGIIISTALVSIMVIDDYNCAIAHSLYYGLVLLPEIEDNYLHGCVVAYGVLVQLAIDGKLEEAEAFREFLRSLGIPVSLKEMKVDTSRKNLNKVLQETVIGPDLKHMPYVVTEDMVYEGILQIEQLEDSEKKEVAM